jgi:hypothetical protein
MSTTSANNTVLLFSHGFGIRKDNIGLFTFLSERFQGLGYETVLFDYYDYNEETKEVYTVPFSKQAEILQKQLNIIKEQHPDKEINIIAHSQGCIIPTLCDVTGVSRVVGISPFFLTDKSAVFNRYSARSGSVTDFDNISRRKHSDGTTTVIHPEYWTERFNTHVEDLYNDLALKTKLTLICGMKDEIMKDIDLRKFKYTRIINTESNHDFTLEYREMLYKILLQEYS